MRHTRFHIDHPLTIDACVTLPEPAAQHAIRVLRLAQGDAITLFNGDGLDYRAELIDVERRRVAARITAVHAAAGESPLPLTLVQALARGDKMDLIVQKATELGVTRVVPVFTERSEVRLDGDRSHKRAQHWRAVAAAACEQCGRARLPTIEEAVSLQNWLANPPADDTLRLALLPDAQSGLRQLAMPRGGATLVVGPEGGLGERDTASLCEHQFIGLRLGPRILRTETAGLTALAALQALFGDL